ncbi:MAG: DNA gyrase subunit B, partial [Nevskiales bacterium]
CLTQASGEDHRYAVSHEPATGTRPAQLRVTRTSHGVPHEYAWSADFFASPEYQRRARLGAELQGLVGPEAEIARGEQRAAIANFREAHDWLLNEARRGQHVQRYKGLGEMNPEQLWDTTMNPETRRLLRVRVEDGYAAEQIFSTLMGDEVEPRRQFIERNALLVSNLDV